MAKTAQPRSDATRANWCVLIALLVAIVTNLPAILSTDAAWLTENYLAEVLMPLYLVFWPVFVLAYLAWTHRSYARIGGGELAAVARREAGARARWWHALLGYGGAASWTVAAAVVAVALTIAIAQRETS